MRKGLERHDAGNYDKAIELYLEGLKFCSKENKDLFYSELSFSYGLKNELDQSNKYAFKVLKSSDRLYNYAFQRISNNYLVQKEYKKLRKLTKKAIKKHGERVIFLRNYAFLELRAEQFEESQKWLKKICLSGDGVGRDFVLLGIVENKLAHMDAALMDMTFGLFLDPENSKADVAISFLEQYLFGKSWEKDCQELLKAKEEKELYKEIYQPFFKKFEKEGRKKLYSYYIFSGTEEGKDNMLNDTELRVIIQKIEEERGQN